MENYIGAAPWGFPAQSKVIRQDIAGDAARVTVDELSVGDKVVSLCSDGTVCWQSVISLVRLLASDGYLTAFCCVLPNVQPNTQYEVV